MNIKKLAFEFGTAFAVSLVTAAAVICLTMALPASLLSVPGAPRASFARFPDYPDQSLVYSLPDFIVITLRGKS